MKRMGNNKMSQRKILQHFVKKVAWWVHFLV
jgi:hypothetical protein